MRGNRYALAVPIFGRRSIPACAGEPLCPGVHHHYCGVYPRVCGGTHSPGLSQYDTAGLSPRVRGNRLVCYYGGGVVGSIPACAGEPTTRRRTTPSGKVYPRVCGGTQSGAAHPHRHEGLSPRVRGNRTWSASGRMATRSIPACAGEPRLVAEGRITPAVYPRVCGGTQPADRRRCPAEGLSPRVRGNLGYTGLGQATIGSIPACAGEPGTGHHQGYYPGVYPRVCGGTPAC